MEKLQNYYEILGVGKKATNDEIKQAYRSLAKRYHPDRNPGSKRAEERFKDINEAYKVLSDFNKRSQYDRFDEAWGKKGGNKKTPRYNPFDEFSNNDRNSTETKTPQRVPVDPYNYRPGTTRRERPVRTPKRDIEAKLTLPLSKAYKGGRERIRLEDGRSLEVDMPSAMFNGQRIRLKGQGIDGGDLYLKITVARHPFFNIRGTDVYCQIPITPSEAVLGGSIEIPTLDGLVKMTLPQAVRSGQRLRLSNKGYPDGNGGRGDQLVEINIVTPKEISNKEKELYLKLQQIEKFKPRQNMLKNI